MKPFILQQHEKDREELVQLRASELELVSGGTCPSEDEVTKLSTITSTPNGDGGDDGCDDY